jgi:serine/threonine protein kinase
MQQLEELFHEALALKAPERRAFMARLRESNPALVAGLESLIAAHEGTDSLIDSPAYEFAAELIAEPQPALVAGQVVGHYQILGPVGKGGMGEVFLASDTKLDRKVALKLLPVEFTHDKSRLNRFIQEAKAASSLNHPNIITIHEIGQTESAHFIATEFIDGQTLKQHMVQGRMNVPEILDISIQAASALNAAHAAGIIHRDIKPENIMLRPDGYVKVLDFGLAKLTESRQVNATTADLEQDTMLKAHTKPGTLMGTFKYMSPEQARGQALDARTDVFSLGIVMYEMTAGRPAFAGATEVDTLVSIIEKDPVALDECAPEVPAELQRIVNKALRKDREERYQTIKDLLIDLKALKEEMLFAVKLSRAKTSGKTVEESTSPNAHAVVTDPARLVDLTDRIPQRDNRPRRIIVIGLVVAVLAASLIAGAMLWPRNKSTPAVSTPKAIAQRVVSYWITVQKYRDGDPYQEPFRLSDNINFENDYRIRLNVTSSQSGRLYLLNEGPAEADQSPTFIVMFPSETANNGSALLRENQQLQIPQQSWFQFDQQQGTEKIWLVWSENEVPELEAVKGFANAKDRGVISSPGLRTAVNQFLKAHSAAAVSLERDEQKKDTRVAANGEILVHVIKLEHH